MKKHIPLHELVYTTGIKTGSGSAFCFHQLGIAVPFHFNMISQNFQVSIKSAVKFYFAEA